MQEEHEGLQAGRVEADDAELQLVLQRSLTDPLIQHSDGEGHLALQGVAEGEELLQVVVLGRQTDNRPHGSYPINVHPGIHKHNPIASYRQNLLFKVSDQSSKTWRNISHQHYELLCRVICTKSPNNF